MPTSDPLVLLRQLYSAAVERALPHRVLPSFLPPPPKGRTVVVGAGKASGAMALAVEQLWPANAPMTGLVITRDHHVPPEYRKLCGDLAARGNRPRIDIVEASHPVPDHRGLTATRAIADKVSGLTADDLVICLISGGGSALFTLPVDGLEFSDKQLVNSALLRSGANIGEMNCVRKHLSRVKGGRLAELCAPAQVVTLAVSDVPGDDPSVIGSGPTVPDESTCADALAVLTRYGIKLPTAVRRRLERGELETPKPGAAAFARCSTHVIATPEQSLQAAAALARTKGVRAHVLSDAIQGESRDVGYVHAALARRIARHDDPFQRPCVILSGGETTVTVRGSSGRGGRALEFVLATALELQGCAGVWALAADTDGIDGTDDHAGAVCTPDTLVRARALGLSARAALDANDTYRFFSALGDLVITGPTYTNVNDFRALLVL